MRLGGKKIEGRNVEIIPIPRGSGENIIFKAQAVLSMDEFDNLVPRPKPPEMYVKGEKQDDLQNVNFLAAIKDYNEKRFAFILLKSLEATESLEWENVNINDPSTWTKWSKELADAEFSSAEVQRIVAGVLAAQGLDETKIQEARESFLASAAQG